MEPGELLVADERLLAGELATAEQTGQLLPVSELLFSFGTPALLLLLTVALPAIGCHQAPRWALENVRVGKRGQAWLDWSAPPLRCSSCPGHSLGGRRWPVSGGPCWCVVSRLVLPGGGGGEMDTQIQGLHRGDAEMTR